MPPVVDEKGIVTKEGKPAEVQAFRDYCWPDAPVYLDEPRAFYDALGGGKANKNTLASFAAKMLNPFSRLWKNVKRAEGTEGNFRGEGLVHGGVYVALHVPKVVFDQAGVVSVERVQSARRIR